MQGMLPALGSLCALASVAAAQPYLSVPYVTTQSPEVFRDLFARSRCGTVRVLIFGDSQENSPNGLGSAVYIARLQYQYWLRAGNVPETPWFKLGVNTGGGNPYADWLTRTANIAGGLTATRIPADQIPPGLSPMKTSTTSGSNVNGNQIYGNLLMLQHDCANIHPSSGLQGIAEFFDRDAPMALDVLAATNPSSGEVYIRVRPTPNSLSSYSVPILATYSSTMSLQGPAGQIRSQRFGPLTMGSGVYMQVEVAGTSSALLTDVVSARYVNLQNPRGWVITSLSREGYKASDVVDLHAACGPMIDALEPDLVFICFGANDCSNNTGPQFRADVEALIAMVRQATRPDLPVVLISDPARTSLPTNQMRDNLDAQAGAHRDIAMNDPRVCALNSRRLTHEAGWTYQNPTLFLADDAHYTAYGATLKANLEALTLFNAFYPASADCNGNGIDDYCDISGGTSQDGDDDGIPDECDCDPDVNCDGNRDGFDVEVMERATGGNMTDFCQPDADYNGDGNLDGFDVEAVVGGVGGAPCP